MLRDITHKIHTKHARRIQALLTVRIPQMVASEVAQTKLETDSGICDLSIYNQTCLK